MLANPDIAVIQIAQPSSLGMTYNDKARGLGLVWQALRYALTHKGLLGLPAAPIRAYRNGSLWRPGSISRKRGASR
jgi:hypothetical protein